jgi:hypothetical protein
MLLCRTGMAAPAMIFLFFKPWGYNNPKLWFSDLMLEVVQIGPITIVLWKIAHFLRRHSNGLSEPAGASQPVIGDGEAPPPNHNHSFDASDSEARQHAT